MIYRNYVLRVCAFFVVSFVLMENVYASSAPHGAATNPPSVASIVVAQAAMEKKIDDQLKGLDDRVKEQEISRHYFSEILLVSTGIYTAIIVVLIALGWVYSSNEARKYIDTEIKKVSDAIDISVRNSIATETEKFNFRFVILEIDLYRSIGIANTEPFVKFLWYLRALNAGSKYLETNKLDGTAIRETLDLAIKKIKAVKAKTDDFSRYIDDINKMLAVLEKHESYMLDWETLRTEVKRVYDLHK